MKARLRRAERELAARDPVLARLIDRHGPCTLERDPHPRFHTLVWAIINQQLSVKAARSIEQRLLAYFGDPVFDPRHFYRVRETTLRRLGLSGAKVRYIREIARRVRRGELDLEALERMDDETVAATLMELPGIGRWSAEMLMMFSLGRLDVLPVGDLALRKSMRLHWGLEQDAPQVAYQRLAEAWRPWRTVASWYIWAAVD
ncbi:MAG TPA: DNA-3-methyladenine glycosylase 2 family protein [Gammaproteobacteria bacterium]|nr:DNA-3-methyladenine glycosylase 2 family protein [Gammaproteobacteria bacterium]